MRRVVSPRRVRDYAARYPAARSSLDRWLKQVLHADWKSPADLKQSFNDVDPVTVASGCSVYIFNIEHNRHRLITAIHFNTQIVYVLRIMTHREHNRNRWKDESMSNANKTETKLGLRPFTKMPTTFAGLCRLLPPRPIRDETDYTNAMEVLDALVGHKLNQDQRDYLEVLTTLVRAYEDTHHAIDTSTVSSLDSLKFLLEQNGMNASELGTLLGNRSLGSKILRGERDLSKTHLRILANRFKVDAGLFL